MSQDHEDPPPLSTTDLMPPPLPTDLVPETERRTDPAPADPVMRLLSEIASKVDALALDVSAIHRKIANLAVEVNATKNQAAAATSEARAARDAAVVTNDTASAIAKMLKEETNGALYDLDKKLDESIHKLTTVVGYNAMQIQTLFEQAADHAALPADEAHGRRYRNGNGNGHDPDIEILSAE